MEFDKNIFKQRITQYKQNLLSVARTKDLIIFLGMLALSTVFWCMTALNNEIEQNYEIPVEITSIPKNVVFLNDPPSTLRIAVRDRGITLLRIAVGKTPVIKLDFKDYMVENGIFRVNTSQIYNVVRKEVGNTVQLVSVRPDSIKLKFTDRPGFKVPVKALIKVKTAPNYAINGRYILSDDSVMVYGVNNVRKVDFVETLPIYGDNLTDTLTTNITLKHIANVRIIPSIVSVTIPIEAYVNKKVSIPVVAKNVPEAYTLITFPASVEAFVNVPISKASNVYPTMFEAVADYDQLRHNKTRKLQVMVTKSPNIVSNISLVEDSVDYILQRNGTEMLKNGK